LTTRSFFLANLFGVCSKVCENKLKVKECKKFEIVSRIRIEIFILMETRENKLVEQTQNSEISIATTKSLNLTRQTKLSDRSSWSFWTVFSSTFITIFLAEMGDKTQLVTLLMSAESQSPWIVFVGAALALIATSLLGVLIGYWLAKKLSPQTLDLSVAILLLFIAAWLIGDVIA
jgi:putative Ca2+/H+ antiporter (TMEM165/GDT1 family)